MAIEIHNLQNHIHIDFQTIEKAVKLSAGTDEADISVSVVDDTEIHAINAKYLNHDRPTDVISFDYRDKAEESSIPSGELIVSGETAQRVSQERGDLDAGAELVLYVIHGVLHLLGYNDQEPEDAARMWAKQNQIMESLGFPGNLSG
ncbi:MAG: rRNA maturation RNase YbeY [Planctomycetes bacterium]|nr:rRNA maturation RNase YbeY [Planctomycetota bacterium]